MTSGTSRRRIGAWLAVAALGLVAAHLADPWAERSLRMEGVYERDLGRLLRIMGFAPTWLLVGAAVWLEERRQHRAPAKRSALSVVVMAMIVGGLGSELLKLLIRRERPGDGGEYSFRAYLDSPFSTRGLGMPSGHTMVAFAGAAAIGRRFPRAAPVLFGLAVGCGLTRVLAHAHFLSDVVAAAIGGTLAGRWAARPLPDATAPAGKTK